MMQSKQSFLFCTGYHLYDGPRQCRCQRQEDLQTGPEGEPGVVSQSLRETQNQSQLSGWSLDGEECSLTKNY